MPALAVLAAYGFFARPQEGQVSLTSQAYGLKLSLDPKAYRSLYQKSVGAAGGVFHPAKRERFRPQTIEFYLTSTPQPYGRIIDPRSREVLKSFDVLYQELPLKLTVKMYIHRRLLFDRQGKLKPTAGKLVGNYLAEILYFLSQERRDFYTGPGYRQFLRFADENREIINSLVKLTFP